MFRRVALRVATVLQYSCNTKLPTQDDCYDYGLYPLVDRYSMDQVPQQNRGPKGTVADKGSKAVRMKKLKTHFHKERFCTLNVTLRAASPQNQKLMISFCFAQRIYFPLNCLVVARSRTMF